MTDKLTLPLTTAPLSTLTLPISGDSITIRPMNVLDMKNLAISANKKADMLGMYKTSINILNNCISENIKIEKMPSADLEMAFLKMKSVSSGEKESYEIKCPECDENNTIEVDFENDPVVTNEQLDKKIVLVEDTNVGVNMKDFTYEIVLRGKSKNMTSVDEQFRIMKECVASIFIGDKIILRENIPDNDFDTWFNGLDINQVKCITDYMDSTPTTKITILHECTKCEHEIKQDISGLSDFLA